jgi:hypothetical protein
VKQDALDLIEGDSWLLLAVRPRYHYSLRNCRLGSQARNQSEHQPNRSMICPVPALADGASVLHGEAHFWAGPHRQAPHGAARH